MACLIIAVLLSLSLLGISQARRAARRTACLGQNASAVQMIVAHAATNRDEVPLGLPPGESRESLAAAGPDRLYTVAAGWPAAVAAAGARLSDESLRCPAAPPVRAVDTGPCSEMSMAMFLDPVTLDRPLPAWSPRFFAPRRFSDVVQPARKALLFEDAPYHESWYAGEDTPSALRPWGIVVAACDGSAAIRNNKQTTPGCPLVPSPSARVEDAYDQTATLRYTRRGVLGIDW